MPGIKYFGGRSATGIGVRGQVRESIPLVQLYIPSGFSLLGNTNIRYSLTVHPNSRYNTSTANGNLGVSNKRGPLKVGGWSKTGMPLNRVSRAYFSEGYRCTKVRYAGGPRG